MTKKLYIFCRENKPSLVLAYITASNMHIGTPNQIPVLV